MTTLFQQTVPLHDDELAGRLAEHLVANALVRKSVTDPVPFPVWWRVTDALRATVLASPTDALPRGGGGHHRTARRGPTASPSRRRRTCPCTATSRSWHCVARRYWWPAWCSPPRPPRRACCTSGWPAFVAPWWMPLLGSDAAG